MVSGIYSGEQTENNMRTAGKTQTELLYHSYQEARGTTLTFPQFLNVLNLYPSLLVCLSDGVLDKEEWEGLMKIARNLAAYDDEGNGELQQIYQDEFRYLMDNIDSWQDRFLAALKDHVSSSEGDKEFVLESMYLFANAANGISEVEREKIQVLSEELALAF
ncbi:MAG: hypothetical protein ACFHWX_22885 [Bacteroidota bacterium]